MADKATNKHSRLTSPPAPLFAGKKERDFTKQVTAELQERVIAQHLLYYPIDIERTNFNFYGEAVVKTYLPPIYVNAAVTWEGYKTTSTATGVERLPSIKVHFHRRRLTEDQNLMIRLGDVVLYNEQYFEIVSETNERLMFGQEKEEVDVTVECVKCRRSFFTENG